MLMVNGFGHAVRGPQLMSLSDRCRTLSGRSPRLSGRSINDGMWPTAPADQRLLPGLPTPLIRAYGVTEELRLIALAIHVADCAEIRVPIGFPTKYPSWGRG